MFLFTFPLQRSKKKKGKVLTTMNNQSKRNKERDPRLNGQKFRGRTRKTNVFEFSVFCFSVFLCDLKREICWLKALFSISLIHTKNSSALRIPPLEAI